MERRLAAILAADVVGYTRLMGADERGTLSALKAHREDFINPTIAAYKGRIFKLVGDGALVEFASVIDAVSCAVELQRGMAERNADVPRDQRIILRIAINLGDVIIEGDDIYGDGVNIAARLEGIAEPGGICLSGDAYRQAKGKVEVGFEDLGERNLKNVAEPVRVYRVAGSSPLKSAIVSEKAPLPLPDKPSIAVLPFENLSGDPDQDYFADGMVEEIITVLSRMRWLFVIACNSSFSYRGRAVDVKQVGHELGVRYVLQGSVNKAGNRVRITGQLIDALTGAHLWADRFDGTLEDVFDLQDQVTESVVGAIAPRLERAEIERAQRKPTESLDAYDYYLRGTALVHQWRREAIQEALSYFYKAIELDPNFATAYGMAARCYSMRKSTGWKADQANDVGETIRLAQRVAELGRDDALALCTAGIGLAFVAGELQDAAAMIDQALVLNPNLAWAWLFSGWVKVWSGEPEVAIERVTRAMRLSPQDPHNFIMQSAIAFAHFIAGRYAEALIWAQAGMRGSSQALLGPCVAAASAALMEDLPQANKAMIRVRQVDPDLRISNLKKFIPIQRPEDFSRWADGLRKAGLPE